MYEDVSELRRLQLIENELLKHFKEICEKEHLKYYLLGGTLIGAVRHRGFIPWDDDIDVGMPRNDYETFIKVAGKYLKKQEKIVHYSIKEANLSCSTLDTAKLVNTSVTVHQVVEGVNEYNNIWMDIFPLDGLPSNRIRRKIHLTKFSFYKMKLYLCNKDNTLVDSRAASWKRTILYLGKRLPFRLFQNSDKIRDDIHKELLKYPFYSSKVCGNHFGMYLNLEYVPFEWFGEGSEVEFEGERYIAPDETHLYLTQIYGDYMKLPPVEKRVSQHNIMGIEFEKSNV